MKRLTAGKFTTQLGNCSTFPLIFPLMASFQIFKFKLALEIIILKTTQVETVYGLIVLGFRHFEWNRLYFPSSGYGCVLFYLYFCMGAK